MSPLPIAEREAPCSRLLFEGREVQERIEGIDLEYQFTVSGKSLLLVTEDIPYEETLRIYFLSGEFQILDHVMLGEPYTPGILKDVQVVGGYALEFSFVAGERWRLRILEDPVLGWRARPVRWRHPLQPSWLSLEQVSK
jgi:hypothetical protein